jgi:trehalose 6-phosphate synthase
MPNGIEFEGRYAQVGTYPIGIEPDQFVQGLRRPTVQTRLKQMENRFEGCKVIIGVDRLDYIKGIPQKLHALEVFLTQHPEWIGKVSYPAVNYKSESYDLLCVTQEKGIFRSTLA